MFAFFSVVVAYVAARLNLRNKQVDFVLHSHKQFDELQKKRLEIRVEESRLKTILEDGKWNRERLGLEADMYFDRFWSLQFDGYIAWYDGYVPTSLFTYWLFARWRELYEPTKEWTLGGRTLASSLQVVRKRWATNPDPRSKQTLQLGKFINLMLDLSTGRMVDIDTLLARHGPSTWRRIMRKFFGAY